MPELLYFMIVIALQIYSLFSKKKILYYLFNMF
jgi:hypothetical protein